ALVARFSGVAASTIRLLRPGCAGGAIEGGLLTGPRRLRLCAAVAVIGLAVALLPVVARSAAAQLPPPGSARTWLFAEGNTLPNWYEFIVLINPDPDNDITVHVDYQLEQPAGVPQPGKSQDIAVPAGQRTTIPVYYALGRTSGGAGVYTGVSAKLTSDANFVAE